MSISRLQRTALFGAAAAALAAGACSESTAPSAVDPSAMATAVGTFNSWFSQNAVFQSVLALDTSGTSGLTLVRAAALLGPGNPLAGPGAGTGRALVELRGLAARAPTGVLALFPSWMQDSTFIWDTAGGGHYRIDHTTGGPTNGVRFILYQVDSTGRPRLFQGVPQTTGYVDLIDESTPSANLIHVQVHPSPSLTAADYRVSETVAANSRTLTATGWVKNALSANPPQVNFTLVHTLFSDSSTRGNYQADDGSESISMLDSISSAGAVLDWTVTKGGSAEIVGTITDTLDLTLRVNGAATMTLTGPLSNFTAKTPSGQPASSTLVVAMLALLDGFFSTYYNLSLVFVPGLLVFG